MDLFSGFITGQRKNWVFHSTTPHAQTTGLGA